MRISILGQLSFLVLAMGCGEEELPPDEEGEDTQSGDTGVEVEFEGDEAGECSDGADNDRDGLFDCEDPDCEPSPECDDDDPQANQAPSQPSAEITPADADSSSDLTCTVTVESLDPEDDPLEYIYAWDVDGIDSGISSATVMARFTAGEETWSCEVFATDGLNDSTSAYAEIFIPRDNTPPTAPEIGITPEEPIPLDDLVCSVLVDSVDAEDDPVSYTWSWLVDGVDAGIETDTVGGDLTETGEEWTCVVVPSDGIEDGEVAMASVEIPTCYGSALEFNGTDDHVLVEASSDFSWDGAFTIEAWIRWEGENAVDDQVILDHGPEGDYSFTLSVAGQSTSDHPICGDVAAGSILFQVAGYSGEAKTCVESASQLVAGDWAHVAVTYDAPDMYIFLDGVESVYGRTGIELNDASAYDLGFGSTADGESSFYGIIDELRVSSSARYTSDFTTEQSPDVDADTILLFHMDEGYGSSLTDETGLGHDGIIESATWSAWSSCDAIGAR